MAITKKKVVQDLNWIRTKTPVKFKSFGLFFLKLMLMSIEDQEYVVDSLKNASKEATAEDQIVINDILRPSVELKDNEHQYRLMVEHDFNCKFCHMIRTEEVNLFGGKFRHICEECTDRAMEYDMDQMTERMSGSDEDND